MRILIIGGVAGGASTAARLRRLSETDEIIMFERGPDISYANCGIPYHIGNIIRSRKNLVLVNKYDFKNKLNVEVRLHSEVISIDREKKLITVSDLANNKIYNEPYDKLVLSPGGAPIRPGIPGINDRRIFTLRNLEDMDAIISHIKNRQPQKCAVIGAGFIGLEIAENLKSLGINVTIIELSDQVMNLLDYEMACFIHQHLKSKNIGLYLKDGVKKIIPGQNDLTFQLNSGRKTKADMAVLAIGVKPEIDLAVKAGLHIGQRKGIRVNEYLQTNDENIFALGDATEIKDVVYENYSLIPLANSANKQGRIVADNIIFGPKLTYDGTAATAIAKVFDLNAAAVGYNEKLIKKYNLKYDKVYLTPSSHAGYYPDASQLIFKLIYEVPNGKILGAQIIGTDGVDKRIDVLAAMIHQNKTVYDLCRLELAYAPPYSSAKDPVNLAGMVAVNQIEEKNKVIFWHDVKNYQDQDALFIDVRTKAQYEWGHIENAVNIPWEEIRDRLSEFPKNRDIVLYCNQGKTAYFALRILLNHGYTNAVNLSGGYSIYQTTGLMQENI